MITRPITRPVTSPIARAVTGAYGAVWNPRALFANGEQGVIYDPNDLTTLYQDYAGTTPVTAAGQPVGLMLDKSNGLVRGPELVTNGDFSAGSTGWTVETGWVVSGGTPTSSGGTGRLIQNIWPVAVGSMYEIDITFSAFTSGYINITGHGSTLSVIPSGAGKITRKVFYSGADTRLIISSVDLIGSVDRVSVKSVLGNHAVQPTAASRPMLRDTPRRIDYDAVDDSLGITFPASLGAACTVARSIPGVGAQILTSQTIGTSFVDNVDNCALIIINRALTAAETTNLTNWLNWRAGV